MQKLLDSILSIGQKQSYSIDFTKQILYWYNQPIETEK